jgi:hypothetical protein
MTKEQEERLVIAWEGVAKGLGALHEIARTAIGKQWPESKPTREAVVSRLLTAEDKLKEQTGNTDGPIQEWLEEFDPEEEIGPREREFLAGQGKNRPKPSSTKTSS